MKKLYIILLLGFVTFTFCKEKNGPIIVTYTNGKVLMADKQPPKLGEEYTSGSFKLEKDSLADFQILPAKSKKKAEAYDNTEFDYKEEGFTFHKGKMNFEFKEGWNGKVISPEFLVVDLNSSKLGEEVNFDIFKDDKKFYIKVFEGTIHISAINPKLSKIMKSKQLSKGESLELSLEQVTKIINWTSKPSNQNTEPPVDIEWPQSKPMSALEIKKAEERSKNQVVLTPEELADKEKLKKALDEKQKEQDRYLLKVKSCTESKDGMQFTLLTGETIYGVLVKHKPEISYTIKKFSGEETEIMLPQIKNTVPGFKPSKKECELYD